MKLDTTPETWELMREFAKEISSVCQKYGLELEAGAAEVEGVLEVREALFAGYVPDFSYQFGGYWMLRPVKKTNTNTLDNL